jgi:hypothetical protein
MAFSETLASRIRESFAADNEVTQKKIFGGKG